MWPRGSPDGRRIVFDSAEAGDSNLYIIDAELGIPRRLTPEPSTEAQGTWSHDGRWIYFTSDRSGSLQIWKVPTEGGEAVQVTRGGGDYPQESWDDTHLYYAKSGGIWRIPVRGGDESEVLSGPVGGQQAWALSSCGIYYLSGTAQGRRREYAILYVAIGSGR